MTFHNYWGSITDLDVDAIVNAANESLMFGGGVSGDIFMAAGEELDKACAAIGHCGVGQAVLTPGFKTKAKWIVHTVGPVFTGDPQNGSDLASCYRESIRVAKEAGAKSIAFPAISTGQHGFPPTIAMFIAMLAIDSADIDVTMVHYGVAS